jgi:hypothetical protein
LSVNFHKLSELIVPIVFLLQLTGFTSSLFFSRLQLTDKLFFPKAVNLLDCPKARLNFMDLFLFSLYFIPQILVSWSLNALVDTPFVPLTYLLLGTLALVLKSYLSQLFLVDVSKATPELAFPH